MWKGRGMIKERRCRVDVKGREMIKGRGMDRQWWSSLFIDGGGHMLPFGVIGVEGVVVVVG